MTTEITIRREAANNMAWLIHEYLTQGGTGFDEAALAEAFNAICNADRIVIQEEDA